MAARLTFPAVESALHALLTAVAERAQDLGVEHAIALKLQLILEELFLNTVNYGDAAAGQVDVALTCDAHEVHLVYEDCGVAHDPFATVDRAVLSEAADTRRVGGLGVLLVEGLASRRQYERVEDRNRIELFFTRPGDGQAR